MAIPAQRARWELTATALRLLLARLDADPQKAADAYETLRLTLTRFFDWRGARRPDEGADETLNRLARKLEDGADVEDVRQYALGIARLVWLETTRSPWQHQQELDETHLAALPAAPPEPETPVETCFDACLASLPDSARHLILEYYQDQKRLKIDRRVRLAEELGLSANALRSRAQRIRDRLERCVHGCAGGGGVPSADEAPT